MSLFEAKGVVSEVSDMLNAWTEEYSVEFYPSFNITGGEPFLCKDIFEIIEEIKRRGFDIFILSNGTLINRERARMLSDFNIKGVQRLGFSRLVPWGRGANLLNSMLIKEKLKKLYETIHSLKLNGLEIVTGDPIFSQMSLSDKEDEGSIPIGGCAAGVSGLTILQDGTVTPCRRLRIPIGNVRRDSLRELWSTSDY